MNTAGPAAFIAGNVTPSALNISILNANFQSEIEPLAAMIVAESAEEHGGLTRQEIESLAHETAVTAAKANNTTVSQILGALSTELSTNDDLDIAVKLTLAILLIRTLIGNRRSRSELVSSFVTTSAWNYGAVNAAEKAGKREKVWITEMDERVRSTHRPLHGQSQLIGEPFIVNGVPIRFPGDPRAPISMTANCRCRMRFR